MKAIRCLNLLVIALLLLHGSPVQSAPPSPESPTTTTTTPQLVEDAVVYQPIEDSIAPRPVEDSVVPPPEAMAEVQPTDVTPLSAVATGYTFSASAGSYTEFTGGLTNSGGSFMTGATIGFTFHYNGVAYTDLRISSEGFVLLGDGAVSNSYCVPNPIGDSSSFCANALAPLGMALEGNPASHVRRGVTGSAPNRVYTVQWKDHRTEGALVDAESFTFQLKLYETTDVIEFVYGPFTKDSVARTPQVGIRGEIGGDYQTRATAPDWANSASGTSSLSMMLLSSTVSPTLGLTYRWTPVGGPDLTRSSKTAPASTPPGRPLTYTLHIANTGYGTASAASVVDPIPAHVTYNPGSVTCSSGACSYDSGAIRWNGTVTPLTTVLVAFTVNTDGLSWAEAITNTAVISDPSALAPVEVSAVSVYGYATQPVLWTPALMSFDGCNDGTSQTRAFTLLNNTHQADTFDLSYTLDEPAVGAVSGPAAVTLANGEAISVSVTLTTTTCFPDGMEITGQVRAVGRATAQSAMASFAKPAEPASTWVAAPNSKPTWGGGSFPGDGCTAKNADGQWVTYIIGDVHNGGLTGFVGYNHTTNTWAQMGAANQPAERYNPDWAYDADANLCYLTGGANNSSPGTGTYTETYRYDPVANSFTALGGFTTARNFHDSWVGTVDGVKRLCVGGGQNNPSGPLASTQCYDLSQTAPGAWAAENATLGAFPATVWGAADGVHHTPTGDQFWSGAGSVNGATTSDLRYWDDADNAWHTVAAGGWVRYRVEGDFVNGDFYIVGGSAVAGFSPTSAASRYHFDGDRWVLIELDYMANSRMDNVANAGGNALWSVDGYGGNASGYVERLDICPTCADYAWLTGHVYDYDGINPPVTPYQLKLMPGNVTIPLDANGVYTRELTPWPYRLTASAEGYAAPVTATVQMQHGQTTTQNFVLARPDVVLSQAALSEVLYVGDEPVSITRTVMVSNAGTLPLTFKIAEEQPATRSSERAIQAAAPAPAPDAPLVIDPALTAQMMQEGKGSYLITLREQADLSPAYGMNWRDRGWYVYETLQQVAERSQAEVRAYLDAQGVKYQAFWIENVIAVEDSDTATFMGLQAFSEVAALHAEPTLVIEPPQKVPPRLLAPTALEPNLTHIKADQVWAQGITGAGIVVANIDTGVRYTHQALVGQYRGNLGGGTFNHNYNWFDPYDLSAAPNDADLDSPSHGSHTLGTMVGDDGAGNQIGVAPDAQWIACQGFNPGGTPCNLLACGQFLAAPTDTAGNHPNPDMRPHIVNNSWGDCATPGEYTGWFESVLNSWHAAGIYPVFSNGNSDATCPVSGLGKVSSPAASARVTAVGALGRNDGALAYYSLWGPTDQVDTWNPLGYPNLKPQVAAPGTNRSGDGATDNAYVDASGTSMAAPHVAGVVALMWSAASCMIGNYTDTETILMQTAMTATTPGYPGSPWDGPSGRPNQATGWGEVDALAAVAAAQHYCEYNWNPWASASPTQAQVAPAAAAPIAVAFTCAPNDALKAQPLTGQLTFRDNDPAENVLPLSLDCLPAALRLSQLLPAAAASGDLISLQLVIRSDGHFSDTATLTNPLPSGLTFAGSYTATAGVLGVSNNVITWTYNAAPPATLPAIVTLTVAARVTGDYVWNGSLGTAWDAAGNWTAAAPRTVAWLTWAERNGPTLHLPLDEAAGATAFADSSSSDNPGACSGAGCPTAGVTGKRGYAAQFDGLNDVITVADAPSLRNAAFTISAWFRWDGVGTDAVHFLTAKGTENMELHTGGGAGVNGLRFIPAGYSATYVDAANVIAAGWNHVAATYDGSAATLYVNGVLVGSRTGIVGGNDLTADSTAFYVGRRSSGVYPFAGAVDDVRVYNRVLSPTEIARLAAWREGRTSSARTVAVTGLPGLYANVTLPAGAPTYPTLNINAGIDHLTLQPGSSLTIPVGVTLTVESGVVNSGTLFIQRDAPGGTATFFHLSNLARAVRYYGVQLTPVAALGPTWVEIRGNAECTTDDPGDTVNRCVRITPTNTGVHATVRVYYLPGELDGQASGMLRLWQWQTGGWVALAGTAFGGYVTGSSAVWGVDAPLVLRATDAPTAIGLRSFTAGAIHQGWLLLILGGAATCFWRRRR